MGHAAGQVADGIHALGGPHESLRLPDHLIAITGDIPANGGQSAAVEAGRPAKPSVMAVAVTHARLELVGALLMHEVHHRDFHFGQVRWVHQLKDRPFTNLFICPAQCPVPGRISLQQAQVTADDNHGVPRELPDLIAVCHVALELTLERQRLLSPLIMGFDPGSGFDDGVKKTRHLIVFIAQGCVTECVGQTCAGMLAGQLQWLILDEIRLAFHRLEHP